MMNPNVNWYFNDQKMIKMCFLVFQPASHEYPAISLLYPHCIPLAHIPHVYCLNHPDLSLLDHGEAMRCHEMIETRNGPCLFSIFQVLYFRHQLVKESHTQSLCAILGFGEQREARNIPRNTNYSSWLFRLTPILSMTTWEF